MDTGEEIQNQIADFSPKELAQFGEWFQAQRWDEQFEKDVQGGRLEGLANEALEEFQKGNCSDL